MSTHANTNRRICLEDIWDQFDQEEKAIGEGEKAKTRSTASKKKRKSRGGTTTRSIGTRGFTPPQPATDDKQEEEKKALQDRLNKLEDQLDQFYAYKMWHPSFMRTLVWILGLAALVYSGSRLMGFFHFPDPVEPVYTKIEAIKRLGELHLVKHHYEAVIPVVAEKDKILSRKTNQKLQFLLISPIEVSGYIDFSELKLNIEEDSLLRISIPPAQISDAYLDLANTKEFLAQGKFRIFGKYVERINHEEAYYAIAGAINEAKAKTEKKAKANEIQKETMLKAQIFLRNFVSTLGYRVVFETQKETQTETPTPTPDQSPNQS